MADKVINQGRDVSPELEDEVLPPLRVEQHFGRLEDGARAVGVLHGDLVSGDKIINYLIESKTIIPREALQEIEQLPPKPGPAPYKGLMYFTEEDRACFFGRDALSDALTNRLADAHFLALIGASGSGKSSLLRAGLIPRLRARNWLIHLITPGAHPLTVLANSLTQDELDPDITAKILQRLRSDADTLLKSAEKLVVRASAQRLLLAVDQFEELFLLCEGEEEQQAFLDNLVTATYAGSSITLLISMRADCYNRISINSDLTDLVSQHQEYVKPLSEADLMRVIAAPAERGGWQLVAGLLEQIVEDAGREPGRLPLLSHALLETWERRRDTVMTLSGYQESGGVAGAIAQTAEELLQRLSPGDERIVRHVFLSLTEVCQGAQDTRRIATAQELARIDVEEDDVQRVVDALAKARLITIDGDEIQVAHEALIRRWPRLHDWIEEDRERLSFLRRLTRAAEEWDNRGRGEDYLYRGKQLAQTESRIREYGQWQLMPLQLSFVEESRVWAARQEQEKQNIARAGQMAALQATGAAAAGGMFGLLIAAMLMQTTVGAQAALAGWYLPIAAVFGALISLPYVAIFDRLVTAAGQNRPWLAALISVLCGMMGFIMAIWWLLSFLTFGWPIRVLGGAWGAAAGLGRLWIQRSAWDRRITIPLASGLAALALSAAYLLAEWLWPPWFEAWAERVPPWLIFTDGLLVPLAILAAEYAAATFSARRK